MLRVRLSPALLALPALLGVLALAPAARADMPPTGLCDGSAGSPCCTVPYSGFKPDQKGICTVVLCADPGDGSSYPDVIDEANSYVCTQCVPPEGGTSGTCSDGDDAGDVDGTGVPMNGGSSGCSVTPAGDDSTDLAWFFGLAVLGLVASSLTPRKRS